MATLQHHQRQMNFAGLAENFHLLRRASRRLQRHSRGHEIRARFARHLSRQRASVRRFRPRSTSVSRRSHAAGSNAAAVASARPTRATRPAVTKSLCTKHTTTTVSMISSFVFVRLPARVAVYFHHRRFASSASYALSLASATACSLARTSLNANGIAAITNPRRRPRTPWLRRRRLHARHRARRRDLPPLDGACRDSRRRETRATMPSTTSLARPVASRARSGARASCSSRSSSILCRRRKDPTRRRDGVVALALIAPNDRWARTAVSACAAFGLWAERRPWGANAGAPLGVVARGVGAGQRPGHAHVLGDVRRDQWVFITVGGADAVVHGGCATGVARIGEIVAVFQSPSGRGDAGGVDGVRGGAHGSAGTGGMEDGERVDGETHRWSGEFRRGGERVGDDAEHRARIGWRII